jgi:hypothetical protein
MCRPYSEQTRLRSRTSHSLPSIPASAVRATSTKRYVFDISPGQVCSLRGEPLMEKKPGRKGRIAMPELGGPDGIVCCEPFHRGCVGGVGKAGTGRPGARSLASILVGLPSQFERPLELRREGVKGWIGIGSKEAGPERVFAEMRIGHALPEIRGHGNLRPSPPGWNSRMSGELRRANVERSWGPARSSFT